MVFHYLPRAFLWLKSIEETTRSFCPCILLGSHFINIFLAINPLSFHSVVLSRLLSNLINGGISSGLLFSFLCFCLSQCDLYFSCLFLSFLPLSGFFLSCMFFCHLSFSCLPF